MRAVLCSGSGGVEIMSVGEAPDPTPAAGEVVIDVAATAVNRADVMQRKGLYPPPAGASDVLGLECSGTVSAIGDGVEDWKVGDEACALLAGGGYAAQVAVPAGLLLPVPKGVDLAMAAALPEVTCTVWSNVFMVAGLQPEETLLIHGGSSGIGTMAIQLAKTVGARVFVTAGTPAKLEACRELGADVAINYREEDFREVVRAETDGGVNVILDNMGAKYLERNVKSLATSGRLVTIGLQGGRKGELDMGVLLAKRAAVTATSLRGRPVAEKATIVASVREHVWPLIESGEVRPIVHSTMSLDDVQKAHELLESSEHIGKVLMTV